MINWEAKLLKTTVLYPKAFGNQQMERNTRSIFSSTISTRAELSKLHYYWFVRASYVQTLHLKICDTILITSFMIN